MRLATLTAALMAAGMTAAAFAQQDMAALLEKVQPFRLFGLRARLAF